jgi:hypothetical protein
MNQKDKMYKIKHYSVPHDNLEIDYSEFYKLLNKIMKTKLRRIKTKRAKNNE